MRHAASASEDHAAALDDVASRWYPLAHAWSYSVGDAESVMHGVGPGLGLRAVLVFCVHAVMARGVDYLGLKVDWGKKTQSASK